MTSPAPAVRRKRPARQQFASTILLLEAFLVLFAALTAYGLRVAPAAVLWIVAGAMAVTLAAISRLLTRPGGYVAGTVAQVLVLASGVAVPMMFVVGTVFVVLWFVALQLGARIDRERAEWDAAHPDAVPSA
ncbi:DUF4233 domain-containing protein [Cellulomonas hominis]